MSHRKSGVLLIAWSAAALGLGAGGAQAGGFALREQSAYGQGASYAGIAAGGALSSMYYNPATLTQVHGIQIEGVLAGVMPYSSNTVGAGSTFAAYGGTDDTAKDALVPSGYVSWQIDPKLWLGLSVNSPFGLQVTFPDSWAGRNFAGTSGLKTYNATPTVAYEISDWLSVGAGVQIQYAKADLSTGLPTGLGQQLILSGHGWGYGFTAGVTVKPTPTTTIGVGYRSRIDQPIDGTMSLPAGFPFTPPVSTPGDINTTLRLPDTVTASLRQILTRQWTLLGTVEWANWSRIGSANVYQPNGAPAQLLNGFGGGAVAIPFNYSDGWFYSVGAEYTWGDALTLRGGVGYEKSPVTDAVRTPRLPDNDRVWASIGASYRLTPRITVDAAYSHLFVRDTSINDINSTGTIVYNGTVDSHIDIVSVGLHYRWDEPARERQSKLYTK